MQRTEQNFQCLTLWLNSSLPCTTSAIKPAACYFCWAGWSGPLSAFTPFRGYRPMQPCLAFYSGTRDLNSGVYVAQEVLFLTEPFQSCMVYFVYDPKFCPAPFTILGSCLSFLGKYLSFYQSLGGHLSAFVSLSFLFLFPCLRSLLTLCGDLHLWLFLCHLPITLLEYKCYKVNLIKNIHLNGQRLKKY